MAQEQLNAGSLGGRFLRRTFLQKVKPVPSLVNEQEVTAAQAKQCLPDTNRRVRTSAAMIGLAISMGAYSLPIARQGEQATAAEPPVPEDAATASVPQTAFETAAVFPGAESSQSMDSSQAAVLSIKHSVQEGQALWDVARFYGVDAASIAVANHLSLNAVLHVGQVLIIPTDTRVAQAVGSSEASVIAPGYYGPVSGQASSEKFVASSTTVANVDTGLKASQDKALENLKQKRESLKAGLHALQAQPDPLKSSEVAPSSGSQPMISGAIAAKTTEDQMALSGSLVAVNPEIAMRAKVTLPHSGSVEKVGSFDSYRVAPGDTLGGIARQHGVSIKQLIEANRISNPNHIFANQVLAIPQQQEMGSKQKEFKAAIASVPPVGVSDTTASGSVVITPANTEGTKVAAVSSFAGSQSPSVNDAESSAIQSNQVETLKQEIDRLREKYQNRAGFSDLQTAKPAEIAVANPASTSLDKGAVDKETVESVNPEFNPSRYSELSTRIREMRNRVKTEQQGKIKDVSSATPAFSRSQPQVVAAAPLGSESYDPLVKSRVGQTVSPDLPPLGTGTEYLPGGPGKFEGYIWPTKGVLTSGFGWRWGRMHKGIDIAGPVGTPVMAAAEGVVSFAGWNSGGYGYLVEIQHADGSSTLYAHNSRILVQSGQQVAQGQQISEMGSTGFSTGPHLHFEVHPTGKGAVNPMAYLPRG